MKIANRQSRRGVITHLTLSTQQIMYKIGWFSTGRGQGSLNLLRAIVNAVKTGAVPAEIAYVFCSREPGDADGSDNYISQDKHYGLNPVCFSSRRFKPELRQQGRQSQAALEQWRKEYDLEIMKRISGIDADISVLAGYMLVVSAEMCKKHDMINLHPAAPDGPAGTWQEVIWQLIAQEAKQSGNMMHLVTKVLDKGPPITYGTFPLIGGHFDSLWNEMKEALKQKTLESIIKKSGEQNYLFQKIRQEGAKRELPLVIQTVRAFAQKHLQLKNKKIIADGKILNGPYCLTDNIEEQLNSA